MREYHHRGRQPGCKVIRPLGGKICAEHILTIWRLYETDELTMEEIAEIYCTNKTSISRAVKRIRDHDAEGNGRYIARAQRYAEALAMLDDKRGYPYEVIASKVKLSAQVVREIAARNGLERRRWVKDGHGHGSKD